MAPRGTSVLSPFCIDASIAAAWLFEDEQHPDTDALLPELDDSIVFVPQHWHLEVRNALLVGERRGRITSEEAWIGLSRLSELPLRTDTGTDLDVAMNLARYHGLSLYDAVYLELAHRRELALATLDRRLAQAATATGLVMLP